MCECLPAANRAPNQLKTLADSKLLHWFSPLGWKKLNLFALILIKGRIKKDFSGFLRSQMKPTIPLAVMLWMILQKLFLRLQWCSAGFGSNVTVNDSGLLFLSVLILWQSITRKRQSNQNSTTLIVVLAKSPGMHLLLSSTTCSWKGWVIRANTSQVTNSLTEVIRVVDRVQGLAEERHPIVFWYWLCLWLAKKFSPS